MAKGRGRGESGSEVNAVFTARRVLRGGQGIAPKLFGRGAYHQFPLSACPTAEKEFLPVLMSSVGSKKPTWNFPTSRCQEEDGNLATTPSSPFPSGSRCDKPCRHGLGGITAGQLWGGGGNALSEAPNVGISPQGNHTDPTLPAGVQGGGEEGGQQWGAGAIC